MYLGVNVQLQYISRLKFFIWDSDLSLLNMNDIHMDLDKRNFRVSYCVDAVEMFILFHRSSRTLECNVGIQVLLLCDIAWMRVTSHERHGVSNHWQLDYSANNLFKRIWNATSKPCITGTFDPPGTDGFLSQGASNWESVSIPLHHLAEVSCDLVPTTRLMIGHLLMKSTCAFPNS